MEYNKTYRRMCATTDMDPTTYRRRWSILANMFRQTYRPTDILCRYAERSIISAMNAFSCYVRSSLYTAASFLNMHALNKFVNILQISTWFDPTISYYMAAGRIIHIPDHSAAALSTFVNPNTLSKPLDDCSILPIIWRKVCNRLNGVIRLLTKISSNGT